MDELKIRLEYLTVDPEFGKLIRKQTPDEAADFEYQMLNHGGAHDPIMVWDNDGTYIILDGHHRYWFLLKHPELTYRVEIAHEVHDRAEAGMWIYRQQKGKKNLKPFELAELALKFEPMLKEEAKKRQLATLKQNADNTDVQNSAPRSEKNKTRDEVARIAGVSHDTIDKAKKILANGTESQIAAVRSGEKSINKTYNEIFPPKPKAPPAQSQSENIDEEEEVDTQLPEEKKIAIAIYRRQHPEETVYWMAKQCGVTSSTAEKYQNYPIPEDYQYDEMDTFAGVKYSKLPVETQKAIIVYCKDHELETTGSIASMFGVDRSSVEKLRNHIGQADPSARSMSKQIAQLDVEKAIYDISDIHPNEYTCEDAMDELTVIKDEFIAKAKRVLVVRKNLIGGNKEVIKLLESFAKEIIKELVSEARKRGKE